MPFNREITTVSVSLRILLVSLLLALFSPAHAAPARDLADPWESFNRRLFAFNELIDRTIAKPVARGYAAITPQPVDDAITRFFHNLQAPITVVNALLQGKVKVAAEQTSRFLFNTTLGVVGFFDVATRMGLPRKKEDFGQTLAVWGVPSGPYLMLPLLGPSTIRDFGGRIADIAPDPRRFAEEGVRLGATGLDLLDTRADFLPLDRTISGDRYKFLRDYYLQQRDFDINDGKVVKDDFLDESLEDDAERAGAAKP